jgi:hypothetical protein
MRYDRGYDRDSRRGYEGWMAGWYPWYPTAWAGMPYPGFGWGGALWPPYVPVGYGVYDAEYTPRVRPAESPTYGRAGDEAVRSWARRHGYDTGYAIPPRGRGGNAWRRYGRYDRGYRGGSARA